jgi:hypothetical protein
MNEALPKLLRAIANGTAAKEAGHDVALNLAANKLERLQDLTVTTIVEVWNSFEGKEEWTVRKNKLRNDSRIYEVCRCRIDEPASNETIKVLEAFYTDEEAYVFRKRAKNEARAKAVLEFIGKDH